MRKLTALIALCASYLVYADGYADLVAIQKNFPNLVSQHSIPGVGGSAPEVPYVAGSLGDPKPTDASAESAHLKEALYAMGQTGAATSHAEINFTPLNVYNKYKHTGHSTFGTAAQERVDLSSTLLLSAPSSPPPPPPATFQGDDTPVQPAMAGILAGFGGFKKKVQSPGAILDPLPTVASAAPIGKPLLARVQEKLATLRLLPASKDNTADIAILEMLVAELMAPVMAGRSEEETTKFEDLKKFFTLLETPPISPAGQAMVGKFRMTLKPKQAGAVAFAVPVTDPIEVAIEQAVNKDFGMTIPKAIIDNKKAISKAIDKIRALGSSAKDFQTRNLILLSRRHVLIADDDDESNEESDDEGSDDDDTSPVIVVRPKLKPATAAPSVVMLSPPAVITAPPTPGVATPVVTTPAAMASVDLPPPPTVFPLSPPPTAPQSPIAVAQAPSPSGDGTGVVDIDTWAEQEFQREKQAIQDQIDALKAVDVNALKPALRMARRQEIARLLQPLNTDLAKYEESFGKDRIIKEIKKRYPYH